LGGWKGRFKRFQEANLYRHDRSRWRSSRVAGVRCCCRRESSLFAPLFPWGRERGGDGWDGKWRRSMSVEADVFVGFRN